LFFLNKPDSLRINVKQCKRKDGCDFEVEAMKDVEGVLYAGKSSGGNTSG
jgi:hypothetical protein